MSSSLLSVSPVGVETLEHKLRASERRTEMAEERAERNQQLLNQKMLELAKLQNTLSQTTKVCASAPHIKPSML